jgi:SAM-dependent methyltransferase
VALNPPGQYADDRNLNARQRLWRCQVPFFEFTAWVLDLAGLSPGMTVLDAGCGNGAYLRAVRERGASAVGCDLSLGMLRGIAGGALVNADVTALPVRGGAFDLVIAGHLLDLVPDRRRAIRELRRVLEPGGTCVAVTTGAQHLRSLRAVVEQAVRVSAPDWRMQPPTGPAFTRENAAAQLGTAFAEVTCVRAAEAGPVIITDAAVAADYVSSLADHYQPQVARPWRHVAEDVRSQVQAAIDAQGEFRTAGDVAAFVCRGAAQPALAGAGRL